MDENEVTINAAPIAQLQAEIAELEAQVGPVEREYAIKIEAAKQKGPSKLYLWLYYGLAGTGGILLFAAGMPGVIACGVLLVLAYIVHVMMVHRKEKVEAECKALLAEQESQIGPERESLAAKRAELEAMTGA